MNNWQVVVSANNNVTSFNKKTDGLNGQMHLQRKIKALLCMLATLPRGRRDMLGSMNGKHG